MNFLIYYGMGLAFVTGVILYIARSITYFDAIAIKSWGRLEWIVVIAGALLLALVWPVPIIAEIVSNLYYIIKNKKS